MDVRVEQLSVGAAPVGGDRGAREERDGWSRALALRERLRRDGRSELRLDRSGARRLRPECSGGIARAVCEHHERVASPHPARVGVRMVTGVFGVAALLAGMLSVTAVGVRRGAPVRPVVMVPGRVRRVVVRIAVGLHELGVRRVAVVHLRDECFGRVKAEAQREDDGEEATEHQTQGRCDGNAGHQRRSTGNVAAPRGGDESAM